MATDWGASSTGKAISVPIAASDGLLSVFSGTAATPPDHTIIHIGRVPNSAGAFGTSTFAENTSIQDVANNETYRFRVAPTTNTFSFRLQNTAGTARTTDVVISTGGTNLNGIQNEKYVAALTFPNATRIITSYVVHGAVGSRTTDSATTTALSAGVGLRLADEVLMGVVANRYFPGVRCITAVLNTVLTQANLEAIFDADSIGFFLHTYRANILWCSDHALLADTSSDSTYSLPGQAVTAANYKVYNSGTQTSWYGSSPTTNVITGSIAYIRPIDAGYSVDKAIVPANGENITTEVQNAAVNPALVAVGSHVYPQATWLAVSSNSNGIRTDSDFENLLPANDTYHSSQTHRIGANFAESFNGEDPLQTVGHFRTPRHTGSASSLCDWIGALPSTGTISFKSGSTSVANDPTVDMSRCLWSSEFAPASGAVGPGQFDLISASGGVDYIFANVGAILPTDPIRVWVLAAIYPGSATVTVQGVSHASTSSTVPFASAAANYATGTLQGSATGPITLSNAIATSTVVMWTAGSKTLVALTDPGVRSGEVVCVARGTSPCFGYVLDPSGTPSMTMEFTMGTGTGIPTLADTIHFGGPVPGVAEDGAVHWRWISIDVAGGVTPSPWRGVRVTAGASGLPVMIARVGVQKLTASNQPAPGRITFPIGWGGAGYSDVAGGMPITPGPDGLTALQRWMQAVAYPSRQSSGQIRAWVVTPAQQNSSASTIDTITYTLLGCGWTNREVAFASDFPSANNTSSFATQSYQDFSARGLILGPAAGIVAINSFDDMGVPFEELGNGWLADIAHAGTQGNVKWATEQVRILSPVADGGGGAALPAPASGGFGSRGRPSRGRPGR